MDPSSAFANPSPFAGAAFMPQPNFMQMMPQAHHESKGFWASWGPVLCAAVITVLVLLLGYLYIFQNRSAQAVTQEPAAIHQITGADIAQPPAAPATVYTQIQHAPRQPQPQPQPQQQQPIPQQGNVIHSNVPLHQVVGFDP